MEKINSSLDLINSIIINSNYIKYDEISSLFNYCKILKDNYYYEKTENNIIENNITENNITENNITENNKIKMIPFDYNCNQKYVYELINLIFEGFIYLASLNEFDLHKYMNVNVNKNIAYLDYTELDIIEYRISEYFENNDEIILKVLDLEPFKYDKETKKYNYTPEEKKRFKSFNRYIEKLFYIAFDNYIINYYFTN
jgi:hypothetical protein